MTMIVRTLNGVYEVERDRSRLRLIRPGEETRLGADGWRAFDVLGPIRVDQPIQAYTFEERAGRAIRFRLWSSASVIEIEVSTDQQQ